MYSAATLDEGQYSAFTSDYNITVRVLFRETLCLDPVSGVGTSVMIAAAAGGVSLIITIVALICCKVKKKACFSNDRRISIKEPKNLNSDS